MVQHGRSDLINSREQSPVEKDEKLPVDGVAC